jgi:hypothetical protein
VGPDEVQFTGYGLAHGGEGNRGFQVHVQRHEWREKRRILRRRTRRNAVREADAQARRTRGPVQVHGKGGAQRGFLRGG